MEIRDLKQYIIKNNLVEPILESLGCHSIKFHDGNPDDYYTCANPDGDNTTAVTVYLNDYLACMNYTRNIQTSNVSPDIISLAEFYLGISFFKALKYIASIIGIDVYKDFSSDVPKSVKIFGEIEKMSKGDLSEEEKPIRKRNEILLTYYHNYVNDMFKNDGIGYRTQREFEIGYDDETNRITIPIRSEFGDLVGVKGRIFDYEYDGDFKYIYLEKCPRNKILYGLYKTYEYIKEAGYVFVCESEKAVMQLWDMGFKNAIGIGGKMVSQSQISKIERLGVNVVLVFDKDVSQEELEKIANKFYNIIEVMAIIDTNDILDEHESPTDNRDKWEVLYKNNIFNIR